MDSLLADLVGSFCLCASWARAAGRPGLAVELLASAFDLWDERAEASGRGLGPYRSSPHQPQA